MEDERDELRAEEAQKRKRIVCSDGYCGADDCSRCRPYNFFGGEYIEDIREREEKEKEKEE